MPARKLKEYLDREGVKYVTIRHSPAYTAQEIAARAHIPGDEMAKTVMLEVDGKLTMIVLPATEHLDLLFVRELLGADRVALSTERDFMAAFPDCEVGAMPPFGNLYDLDVYVTDSLTQDEYIAFNAGTHAELVRMPYEEFQRLVQPRILHLEGLSV